MAFCKVNGTGFVRDIEPGDVIKIQNLFLKFTFSQLPIFTSNVVL